MKPPFGILLVHGDGSRVLRLSLPRWIAYGALGLAAAVLGVVVVLLGDYALLRLDAGRMAALHRRLADQHALLDSFRTRVAAVRSELAGWRTLHAKMWEAFGPEVGPSHAGGGVGGAALEAEVAPAGLRPEDELELLASGVAEEGPRIRALEGMVSRMGHIVSTLPLRWPLRGPVGSEFGPRRSPWDGSSIERHEGIDIGGLPGSPVKSPAAARVVVASAGGDYGKHVMLDHGNGVRTLYGHLKAIEVKAGQQVEKGQTIGLVGSTGRSTGPHLHYELLVQGKPVDPRSFLWER